ncbi:MAG: cell division ATP-binding protein FtsE [Acutalibacteraceae bacterium]
MIHFENVSKVYPNGTKALNHFSLDIERGEFVFVVGASGAGKSTFIKLITREEKATEGKIIVNGKDLVRMKKRQIPYLRRTMGIVFQDFRLIPKMSVYDNTAFALRVIGTPEKIVRQRVKAVLKQVGLENKMKRRPSELSGGEQQRTSLARALVNNPKLIIADEPTGNVDPALSHEIMQLLCDINEQGTTVVVVTHEYNLVREFGKKIILIENGQAHVTEKENL